MQTRSDLLQRSFLGIGVLLLLAALTGPAAAAGPGKPLRPRPIVADPSVYVLGAEVPIQRVVVKFQEGTRVRLRAGSLVAEPRDGRDEIRLKALGLSELQVLRDLEDVRKLVLTVPGSRPPARLFQSPEEQLDTKRRQGEERTGEELADLNLYYEVVLPPYSVYRDAEDLVATLNALAAIEIAYAEPTPSPATIEPAEPAVKSTTPNFEGQQGYLGAAPQGIDAVYAWTLVGGNGRGTKVVDVEYAWRTTHEDMPSLFYTNGSQSSNLDFRNHGTAVLGEMVGVSNGYGVTGIIDKAQAGYASVNSQSTASAINNAAGAVGSSGAVLIELHAPGPANSSPCTCNLPQCDYIPMEYWQANYDAIANAVANGTIVVEAGGNGSSNLDDAAYGNLFNRSVRDSGAILVAASFSTSHSPTCWTNWGSRIDVHAWGENVVTMGYGDLYNGGGVENLFYTQFFSGTSSASPIVTGAAVSVQGVAKAGVNGVLHPKTVRQLLASTGTPQVPGSKNIGPMPNLRSALDTLLNDRSACTPAQGAYISHYTGTNCSGKEHYYTPYFNYDGVKRSWNGLGCTGSLLRTVTNRSYRNSSGTCSNAWPSGNTLKDFVMVYRDTCNCGEAGCAPNTAAYISHFTGLNCTGEEHYYTPYFFYDGVRRSWDGQGCTGTILRTVTNYSYKDSSGTCYNAWPGGNTLSDFLRVYR